MFLKAFPVRLGGRIVGFTTEYLTKSIDQPGKSLDSDSQARALARVCPFRIFAWTKNGLAQEPARAGLLEATLVLGSTSLPGDICHSYLP